VLALMEATTNLDADGLHAPTVPAGEAEERAASDAAAN